MHKELKNQNDAVMADYPRNARVFVSYEFTWGLGLPFALFAVMVPAYLTEIHSPKTLIAFIMALSIILTPLQILTGYYFRNRPRRNFVALCFGSSSVLWLIYNLFFLFTKPDVPAVLQLTLFTIAILWFWITIIPSQSLYNSIFTDCMPLEKRGLIYGIRMLAMPVAIMINAYPAWMIMRYRPSPDSYLISFMIANLFYIISTIVFLFLREHRTPDTLARRKISSTKSNLYIYVRLIQRKMKKNHNYRDFAFFLIIFFVSMMFGSLIVVYLKETLHLKGTGLIGLSLGQMLSGGIAAVLLGKLADKKGYRIVGVIEGLLLSAAFVLLLVSIFSRSSNAFLIYAGFMLYSSVLMLPVMVLMNMSKELFPKHNLSMLLAIFNLLLMPIVLVTSPFAGFLVDFTHSYIIVFVIGCILALVSAMGFLVIVNEPRTHKVFVVPLVRRY